MFVGHDQLLICFVADPEINTVRAFAASKLLFDFRMAFSALTQHALLSRHWPNCPKLVFKLDRLPVQCSQREHLHMAVIIIANVMHTLIFKILPCAV
jgi:hypothetical protein